VGSCDRNRFWVFSVNHMMIEVVEIVLSLLRRSIHWMVKKVKSRERTLGISGAYSGCRKVLAKRHTTTGDVIHNRISQPKAPEI